MSTPLERAEQAVTKLARVREKAQWSADRGRVMDPFALLRLLDEPATVTPADLCQFHAPAGDPCAAGGCGHAAGADCHPRES